MRITSETKSIINVQERPGTDAFIGTWLPLDEGKRPQRKDEQVLEVRRAIDCRDYNTLTTYGKLRTNYKEVVDHIDDILIVKRSGRLPSPQHEGKQEMIRYILKWFIAKVEGRTIAPPKVKKVKKVKKVVTRVVSRGIPKIHLRVGIRTGPLKDTACGDLLPVRRTTRMLDRRVTCLRCRFSLVFRQMVRGG